MKKKSEAPAPKAPHDAWRAKILEVLKEKKINLSEASAKIEKSHAYIQQFIMRGTPQALDEADILVLSAAYNIDADLLRSDKQRAALSRAKKNQGLQPSRRDLPDVVKDKAFALTIHTLEKSDASISDGWKLLEVLEDAAHDEYLKKGSITLDEDEAARYLRFAVLRKSSGNVDNNK